MPEWLSNFLISVYITGFTWLCYQLQPPPRHEHFDAEKQEDLEDDERWYEIEQHEAEISRRYHGED